VKEGTTRRQRFVAFVISGGVLIASAIAVLYTPWLGVFDLRQVVVSGNRRATAVELVTLSEIRAGQPLLSISTRSVKRRLLTHPWVMQAEVMRSFPHTVRFAVKERKLVAWCRHPENGEIVYLAEGGVVVSVTDEPVPGLEIVGPPMTGWRTGDRVADPDVIELIDALQTTVCGSPPAILRIAALPSVELILQNGLQIRLGATVDAVDRLDALGALCRTIEVDEYERIDLRLGGEATLVPRKAVRR